MDEKFVPGAYVLPRNGGAAVTVKKRTEDAVAFSNSDVTTLHRAPLVYVPFDHKRYTKKFKAGDLVTDGSNKAPLRISYFSTGVLGGTEPGVILEDGSGMSLYKLEKYSLFKLKKGGTVSLVTVDTGVSVKLKASVKHYIKISGVCIPVDGHFEQTLDEFEDCDGFGSAYLFNDTEVERAMLASGLAAKTTRGSYRRTDKFMKMKDKIYDKLKKLYDYKPDMDWKPTDENIEALPAPIREYIASLKAQVVE